MTTAIDNSIINQVISPVLHHSVSSIPNMTLRTEIDISIAMGITLLILSIGWLLNKLRVSRTRARAAVYRFHTVMKNCPSGIGLLSCNEKWLLSNQAYRNILGYSEYEIADFTLKDITYKDDYGNLKILLEEIKNKKTSNATHKIRFIHKDNSAIWLSVSISGVYDISGKLDFHIMFIENIDHSVRMEIDLEKNEERWDFELDCATQGALDFNLIKNTLYISPMMKSTLGYTALELNTYEELTSKIHPHDSKKFSNAMNENMTGIKDNLLCEFRIKHNTDSEEYLWILNHGKVLKRDENNNALRIIGTLTDIDTIKRSEKTYKRNYEHLKIALQSGNIGIWELNTKTNELLWDENLFDIYGIDKDKFLNTYTAWITRIHPDDLVRVENEIKNAVINCTPYNTEFRIIKPHGEIRYIHSEGKISNIHNQHKLKMMVGISWDISKHKLVENTLQNALENTRRINEDLEQFIYIASHDLQAPLCVISGYTELLERRYKDKLDSDALVFMQFMITATKQMRNFINGLLDYSRISMHDKTFCDVHCEQVITDVLADLKADLNKSGAEIIYHDLPIIHANPIQIQKLFQNLISNAIKFCEQKPKIRFKVKKENGSWLFSIQDNGIGISADDCKNIFLILNRFASKDKYQGAGVGLAICKKIIDHHGGKIWVESQPGKSSTFYFSIPQLSVAQ
jgi:PAS domain S-box-containing protein